MSLLESRMTHGAWEALGQLRDDRLNDRGGNPINELVHKKCLHKYLGQKLGSIKQNIGSTTAPNYIDSLAHGVWRYPARAGTSR